MDEATPTVIGAGSTFDGLLTFRGSARVDGTLTGTIHATGRLEVGPHAHIQAEVEVDELIVEGLVEGEIRAHRRTELLKGSKLVGKLATARVKVEDGSILEGDCRMGPVGLPAPGQGSAGAGEQERQTPDSATESA